MSDENRRSWGDMAEDELGSEILPGQVLGWIPPATLDEGNSNDSGESAGDGGHRSTEDADDGEGLPSGMETPRSHFSDSSSEGEQKDGQAEDEHDSPQRDLDSVSYALVPNVDANTDDDVDEDTAMPDAPISPLENPNNAAIDPEIMTAAVANTWPATIHNGSMLPVLGTGNHVDADVVNTHFDLLTTGRHQLDPMALTNSAGEAYVVLTVNQGERRKQRRVLMDKNAREPSLFRAENDDKAKIRRLEYHRDLRREELEKTVKELKKTRDELEKSEHWFQRANVSVDQLRQTKEDLRGQVSKAREDVREKALELVRRKAEVEAWKKAFERQKPFVDRSRQWDADKVNTGTQTAGGIVRNATPVGDARDSATQTGSGEGVPLSFAPVTYLELLPSSSPPVQAQRSRQTSTDFQSVESLLDDNNRLQTSNDKMKTSVRELKRKYEELEQENANLRNQVDDGLAKASETVVKELEKANSNLRRTIEEQNEELAKRQTTAEVSLADLDQFMEHGRKLKAACDRYQAELFTSQQKIRRMVSENAKLQKEKSQLELKYRRMRVWAKSMSGSETVAPLPSPCTPFSPHQSAVPSRRPTAEFERRRITELRQLASDSVARSSGRVQKTASRQRGLRMEVEFNLQGFEGILWFLCIVVTLLMLKSTPGVLNDWIVPKH